MCRAGALGSFVPRDLRQAKGTISSTTIPRSEDERLWWGTSCRTNWSTTRSITRSRHTRCAT
eukprot:6263627-Heterocapsa_arctica.AAC.1